MGSLARSVYEVVQQLPPEEHAAFLRLLEASTTGGASAPSGAQFEFPSFSGGEWLAGRLGRDEIYRDESGHALPG